MSFQCPHCKKGEPLYKCPTCGGMAHIDKKKKLIVIHPPPMQMPSVAPFKPRKSQCFPSHFDCQLALPIDQIDLTKLEKVEAKKK